MSHALKAGREGGCLASWGVSQQLVGQWVTLDIRYTCWRVLASSTGPLPLCMPSWTRVGEGREDHSSADRRLSCAAAVNQLVPLPGGKRGRGLCGHLKRPCTYMHTYVRMRTPTGMHSCCGYDKALYPLSLPRKGGTGQRCLKLGRRQRPFLMYLVLLISRAEGGSPCGGRTRNMGGGKRKRPDFKLSD